MAWWHDAKSKKRKKKRKMAHLRCKKNMFCFLLFCSNAIGFLLICFCPRGIQTINIPWGEPAIFKYLTFSISDTAKLSTKSKCFAICWRLLKVFFYYLNRFRRAIFCWKSINRKTRWWLLCICNIMVCLRLDVASWSAYSSAIGCWLCYYFSVSCIVYAALLWNSLPQN